MATTTTNFGWDIPQSTDLVKDGATAIAALGQDIDTALVDLKGGTTGQVLAKATNTDLDFTWVAQDDSNAIQNAIVDAKGDLISATAADTPARLAVGTNGQYLTADSTTATGLKWSAAPSGKILQVVSGASTTLVTSTSSTFITSGITATITPTSATSTILVIISTLVGKGNNTSGLFRLYRNGSSVKNLTDGVGYTGGTVQNLVPYAVNYVDSPASTSALTYALFFANQNGSTGAVDVNTYVAAAGDTEGRITLIEIGA